MRDRTQIVDFGVTINGIPAKLRRAVAIRDQHCRWPGCRRPAWQSDVHHVIYREHGGPTVIENCVMLCKFHHHRGAHHRDTAITMDPDGTLHIHNTKTGSSYTTVPNRKLPRAG